jgi:hypothetical protein
MPGRVKGVLFVDYVRMLRARPDEGWRARLLPEDLPYLEHTIDPEGWYPMATFERLGLCILDAVAHNDLERVRQWGRASVAHVAHTVEGVIVPGDARESLMRLHAFRRSFFDFEALAILSICDGSAEVQMSYGMSPEAEEAACVQTQGFFERLIELADGEPFSVRFMDRAWRGDGRTVLHLSWRSAFHPPAPAEGGRAR